MSTTYYRIEVETPSGTWVDVPQHRAMTEADAIASAKRLSLMRPWARFRVVECVHAVRFEVGPESAERKGATGAGEAPMAVTQRANEEPIA